MLLFLMVGFPSFGQRTSYINIMAGFEHIAHRDKGMSPLMYSGNGFFTGISWNTESQKRSSRMAINFSKGFQRSKYGSKIEYNTGSFRIFAFYHQNKSATKQLHWGWSSNNVFSHRYNPEFVNFMDHYEYFTNFGPAAKYLYPLKIKGRDLTVETLAHLQVIGFAIRPSYTSSYPVGFLREQTSLIKGLLNSAKVFHPGNAWNFGFRPRLNYLLNSQKRLSLGYQYEFYRLNTPNAVTQSSGIWLISLSTRL